MEARLQTAIWYVPSMLSSLMQGWEAARHLGIGSAGVEEGGSGVGEEALAEEVVGLEDAFNVAKVDADGDAHEHVLGSWRVTGK